MLKNYLTTFVRILLQHKIYAAINISGLAIGITSSLFVILYITDELSYDTFHADANRIYRIGIDARLGGTESNYAMAGASFAEAMHSDIKGIKSYLRIVNSAVVPIEYNEMSINASNLILADSNFFSFFSFKLIEGDKKTALSGPDKIVLTESAAQMIFGNQTNSYRSLIGKIILLGKEKIATQITGIAADPPHNSHFHFDAILSIETDDDMKNSDFLGLTCYSYIKLEENQNFAEIAISIPAFFDEHAEPELIRAGGITLAELRRRGDDFRCSIVALKDIHLDSHLLNELESNGNRPDLYILVLIASFVFLLACGNFVNLSTAQALNRAKEISIRKITGALQEGLIGQLMLESFICTIVALFVGFALILLLIKPFNFLASKHLSIYQFLTLDFFTGVFALVITISILAGGYPAFYISSFRPVQVLKGSLGIGSRGGGLRNILVTFQFVVSTVLIMASIIVYQQLQYLQTKNPGYNVENVICLANAFALKNNAEAFKNEIKSNKDFVDAGFCSRIPSEIVQASGFKRRGSDQWNTVHGYFADEDYFNILKLQLASGRFFSKDLPSDNQAVVINEAAARLLGIKNLDQKEYIVEPGKAQVTYEIIGIAKDFNFESLEFEIKPLVIRKGGLSRITVRLTSGDAYQKVVLLGKIWRKYTNAPFDYTFLIDRLDTQYKQEEQVGSIAIVLTFLSIVIACLGLLGLVTYIARQRTKEIGIRKALGASTGQIAVLLSRDLIRLVLIALAIAVPITWYGMNIWLDGFAYRIEFNGLVVAVAGSIIVVIALLTVSYVSIKAAIVNPADSLRSE